MFCWCKAAEQKRGRTEDVGHFKACTKGSEWECNGPSFWCAAAEENGGSTDDVGHFKARTRGSEWECNDPIVPHCFAGAKLQSKRGASQRTLDISKRAQKGVSGSVMAPLFPIVLLLRSCRENGEQHRRRGTFQSTHNRE